MISYYAEQASELYKVQLMNMLWYADALFYKTYNNSMTGLAYRHERLGAFPIGHQSLTQLKNVNVQAEEEYEYTKYHFIQTLHWTDLNCLKNEMVIFGYGCCKI